MCKLKNGLESRGELSIRRECIREKCISLRESKKRKHIVYLANDMDFNTAKDRGPQGWQISKSSPAGTEGDLEGIQQR